ncbi:hypothetical protein EEB13_03270 [Rhodococcus sp. WS3]|nr:hypothetical protein EEB13_03270 [Rhodococcus sp. WS3]
MVAMLRDGGVMFTIAELAAAAQAALSIPVIVVDNGGCSEIRNEMIDRNDEIHAAELGTPNFPALASSLGCHGISLNLMCDVGPAVTAAFSSDRPPLIRIRESNKE